MRHGTISHTARTAVLKKQKECWIIHHVTAPCRLCRNLSANCIFDLTIRNIIILRILLSTVNHSKIANDPEGVTINYGLIKLQDKA